MLLWDTFYHGLSTMYVIAGHYELIYRTYPTLSTRSDITPNFPQNPFLLSVTLACASTFSMWSWPTAAWVDGDIKHNNAAFIQMGVGNARWERWWVWRIGLSITLDVQLVRFGTCGIIQIQKPNNFWLKPTDLNVHTLLMFISGFQRNIIKCNNHGINHKYRNNKNGNMFMQHHMHHELAHSLRKWEFDCASDQTFNVTQTEHNWHEFGELLCKQIPLAKS